MKNHREWKALLAVSLVFSAFVSPSRAQLPGLNEQPWIGYFAGYENARYRFGLSSVGRMTITPMAGRDQAVSPFLAVDVHVGILETLPDGKTVMKELKVETLECADPATDELEKTVVRGKVTGDAAFEVTIEQARGVMSMSGKLLEPGTLKNPLKFVIRAVFPSVYRHANADLKDKKAEKAFEKKIEDDEVNLKWTDGTRKKITNEKEVLVGTPDFNGPGIAEIEVEMASYKGRTFQFSASEGSSMTVWNAKSALIHEGFRIEWSADPAKDKDGKARFTFQVK